MNEEIDWKEEVMQIRVVLQQIANMLSAYLTALQEQGVVEYISEDLASYSEAEDEKLVVREGTPTTNTDSKPQTYVTEESKVTLGNPIIYAGKEFKNLRSCKYGCGYWVSFDHYKKDDPHWNKPIHFTKSLQPLGMGCPKYEK